jgi:integrase
LNENLVNLKLPHLVADTDRHGNVRYYVRKKSQPKVRIHSPRETLEFLEEYRRACAGEIIPKLKLGLAAGGSFRWLCEAYYRSTEYGELGTGTAHVRRLILEGICLGKTAKGKQRGDLPFALMQERHIRDIRDEKSELPEAANSRLKALRQLFSWAKIANHVVVNPATDVKRLRSNSEGFHAWTDEEVERFEAHHTVGTKARLAFALLRYTGVRRSDVVKLGPGMVRNGLLQFTITKGAKRKGRPGEPAPGPKRLALPMLPELRAVIDATPSRHLTYLVTEHGKPFTAAGFGNRFREWCNEAGLRHCSAHGVRKFDATAAAENGATTHELMAMFGWDSVKQAELYTRSASQSKLAKSAMHLLSRTRENEAAPRSVPLSKSGTLRQK